MTENEKIGLRLDQIRTSLNLTQNELAQSLGVQKGFVSNVISGKKGIGMTIILAAVKKYPTLNLRWLLVGTGEMWALENLYLAANTASDQVQEDVPQYAGHCLQSEEIAGILIDHEKRIRALENK